MEAAVAMSLDDFKALLMELYCPNNEMQKLENELWNHTMVGAGHEAYTYQLHELAKLVPRMVTPESYKIDSFPTTTVTIRVSKLQRLKHCTTKNVDHLSIGLRLEMLSLLALRLFMKPQKRFSKSRSVFKRHVIDKRAPIGELEFQAGDKVMLKVSPWKWVIRFGKRRKLNPRYIGPFKILAKVGTVAYRLELSEKLSRVHSAFHISNLKKCFSDEPLAIPLDEIQIDDKLNFIEETVKIIDREVKLLKQSRIPIVKVCSNLRRGPEFTWEREDQMKKKYPQLFANPAPASKETS
ncbi:hypothetical protein Tco_0011060 [Tanacetum coccineum]